MFWNKKKKKASSTPIVSAPCDTSCGSSDSSDSLLEKIIQEYVRSKVKQKLKKRPESGDFVLKIKTDSPSNSDEQKGKSSRLKRDSTECKDVGKEPKTISEDEVSKVWVIEDALPEVLKTRRKPTEKKRQEFKKRQELQAIADRRLAATVPPLSSAPETLHAKGGNKHSDAISIPSIGGFQGMLQAQTPRMQEKYVQQAEKLKELKAKEQKAKDRFKPKKVGNEETNMLIAHSSRMQEKYHMLEEREKAKVKTTKLPFSKEKQALKEITVVRPISKAASTPLIMDSRHTQKEKFSSNAEVTASRQKTYKLPPRSRSFTKSNERLGPTVDEEQHSVKEITVVRPVSKAVSTPVLVDSRRTKKERSSHEMYSSDAEASASGQETYKLPPRSKSVSRSKELQLPKEPVRKQSIQRLSISKHKERSHSQTARRSSKHEDKSSSRYHKFKRTFSTASFSGMLRSSRRDNMKSSKHASTSNVNRNVPDDVKWRPSSKYRSSRRRHKLDPLDRKNWRKAPSLKTPSCLKKDEGLNKKKRSKKVQWARKDVSKVIAPHKKLDKYLKAYKEDIWWPRKVLQARERKDSIDVQQIATARAYDKDCARSYHRLAEQIDIMREDGDLAFTKDQLKEFLTKPIVTGLRKGYRGMELGGLPKRLATSKVTVREVVKFSKTNGNTVDKLIAKCRSALNSTEKLRAVAVDASEADRLWAYIMALGDRKIANEE